MPPTTRRDRPLFVATIGLAAFLLFTLELLAGRLVLPVFGGAPSVWTTALCFFTGVLFAAYAYAHLVATRLPRRSGGALHIGLALVVVALTLVAPTDPPTLRHPNLPTVLDVLLALAVVSGPMAFLLGSTSPLLSAWFATSGRDPWWLYAASNAASLLALLAYPVLVQPTIAISTQRTLLLGGVVVYAALAAVIVIRGLRATDEPAATTDDEPAATDAPAPTDDAAPTRRRTLIWLVCAAVPAGLLSAVTAYLTTDLISAPLLWVGPLAIYLASFVVAFSSRGRRLLPLVEWLVPAAITLLWIPYAFPTGAWPLLALIVVLFGSYGVLAIAIHGRLALDRPADRHLTRFYLTLSAGGLLATTFVAVVAPLVFADIYEYPLLVIAGAGSLTLLARPSGNRLTGARSRIRRVAMFGAGAIGRLIPYALVVAVLIVEMSRLGSPSSTLLRLVEVGAIVVAFAHRPLLLVAGTALVIPLMTTSGGDPLLRDRGFFGVLEVRQSRLGAANLVYSGTTLHGAQMLAAFQDEPTTYYGRTGPLGDVMEATQARLPRAAIGVVGLGTGSVAAYLRPGDSMTFFEIDDAMVRIASDPAYFTFLRDAASPPRIVVGDARLSIAAEPVGTYDLLILDAFSSDAVPAHLLTAEAMAVYQHALKPDGVLAFHLSNRYYDLGPPVAATVRTIGLGALELFREPTGDEAVVVNASYWVVAGRDLGTFVIDGWGPITLGPVLTDDFSDLFRVLRPGE